MKRRPTTELLDTDAGTPAEVSASIRDLQWFNQWFGGIPTMRQLLRDAAQSAGKNSLTVLDVASGNGYLPGVASRDVARDGVTVRFTLADRSTTHLPRNGTRPKVAADALKLPFANSSFDYVSSSLFVHHLAPEDVVGFCREALRVGKYGVLLHDLIRSPLHLAISYAGVPLYRSRITRNDAPASVWQAYTVSEMTAFLKQAGASEIHVRTHFLYRMGILARKRATE
jgi:ubiquinone/menaquinone biosynthesis C-methylase UbiE